ncbi:permease-like cell division protein FtsX [Balneolaceae bacterium ANBcel3]|nr:permease-like cell division protein FtsX [Balneolaceae bacterium ANBcel3]
MSLGYVIKEGFSGFSRTRLASLTSVTALVIAVLLVGVMGRLGYNAYQVVNALKQSVDIEVFLLDVDEQRTGRIETDLLDFPVVNNVTYISKEDAVAIFREEFGTEAGALAELDFLPASFTLEIRPDAGIDEIREMIGQIREFQGVEDVVFNQQLLETLEDRLEVLVIAGIGIGLFILLTAVILVFNTIRLTIYAKRNIIRTMKLVGATNGFIRRPFLFEGLLQGLLAGAIAIGLHFVLFQWAIPYYLPQFGVLAWPLDEWYYLTGAMALLSLIMGIWGSRWAAKKFISQTSIG